MKNRHRNKSECIKTMIKLNKRTSENHTHENIIDENIREITSWKTQDSTLKRNLVFYILTFGILYLIVKIFPSLYIKLNCVPCDANNADLFIIIDENNQTHILPIERENFFKINKFLKKFKFNSLKDRSASYDINKTSTWSAVKYYSFSLIIIFCNLVILFLQSYNEIRNFLKVMKFNKSIPIEIKRDFIFENEVKFKNQSDEENLKISKNIDYLKSESEDSNSIVINDSFYLVPGDIFKIRSGETVPCDCIILDGICTVDESDLTGESNLSVKCALPYDTRDFNYELNRKSFLFHGTNIIKSELKNNECSLTLLVVNTSYNTYRGNLIQNLFYSKQTNFKFNQDFKYFFLVIGIIWLIATGILIIMYFKLGILNWTVNKFVLDIFLHITIVFPPSLGICLIFILHYFHYNLNKKNISCFNDYRINLAGRVNVIIFDKTGTLTEEGLEIHGFQTTLFSKNEENFPNTRTLEFDNIEKDTKIYHSIHKEFWRRFSNNPNHPMFEQYENSLQNNLIFYIECLATCHSIDKLKDDTLGDSIDKKIFDYINWHQEKCNDYDEFFNSNVENKTNFLSFSNYSSNMDINFNKNFLIYDMIPKNSHKITEESAFKLNNITKNHFQDRRYKLTIIKRFEFASKFQAMSVIVKNCLDDSFRFFIKGAPEKIIEFCNPISIPYKYDKTLTEYTQKGYRVLACATKLLPRPNYLSGDLQRNSTNGFSEGNYNSQNKFSIPEYFFEEDRTKFENNLTFLGFIIFKNKLKKDSKDVITTLKECNSKLILATGDNPFTSISVARECEMMDFHKKVFMIDLEKDMLDNFREKIKITPLVIQRRLNGSKLSLKEDIRSSSSRSTLTRQTGRNVDSNHIEADGETRKRQNSKRRKTSNTVDVQNLTSIQQVSQPIKINQQYSTISDRQSMICSERQLLPVKLNKYENKNSTADSLENFQNSFRKLLSSDSYICISGKAFEYVIQNCRKIKNEENPNNINLASPLFNECSSVKNSIPPSEILKLIEKKGKIFYRMSPNHKVELVIYLIEIIQIHNGFL
jgi:magnesium-transporting ATPase (P-type)